MCVPCPQTDIYDPVDVIASISPCPYSISETRAAGSIWYNIDWFCKLVAIANWWRNRKKTKLEIALVTVGWHLASTSTLRQIQLFSYLLTVNNVKQEGNLVVDSLQIIPLRKLRHTVFISMQYFSHITSMEKKKDARGVSVGVEGMMRVGADAAGNRRLAITCNQEGVHAWRGLRGLEQLGDVLLWQWRLPATLPLGILLLPPLQVL